MLDGLCRRTRQRTWLWGHHPTAALAAPPASGDELLPGLGGCGHELISGNRDSQVSLSCHAMLCRTMPCWGKPCVVSDGAVGKEPRGVAAALGQETSLMAPPPPDTGTFDSFLEMGHTDKWDPNNKLHPFVRQKRGNAHNQCGNTKTSFRIMRTRN